MVISFWGVKGFCLLNFVILFMNFEFCFQQYQYCSHLLGTQKVIDYSYAIQVYGKTGEYDTANTIGGIGKTNSFLVSNSTEILIFYGFLGGGYSPSD